MCEEERVISVSLRAALEDEGKRLDVFLTEKFPFLSRERIKKLIKTGEVLVNGEVKKPAYRLFPGDRVEGRVYSEKKRLRLKPQPLPVDVVYEDEFLLVVNKPQGMVVHPGAGVKEGTLVNALIYRWKLAGGEEFRPGIVHRLDKNTMGLLVVAKEEFVHRNLVESLKRREFVKMYRGIVSPAPRDDFGTIDVPIGRKVTNRKKFSSHTNSPKEAVTHYRVLERFLGGDFALVEYRIETGRTHQIRVHSSENGFPVVGDPLYGRTRRRWRKYPQLGEEPEGQMLVSYLLGFPHPFYERALCVSIPDPSPFKETLAKIRALDESLNR